MRPQPAPHLNGLGDVGGRDLGRAGQVGHRASHAHHAVEAARRPAELLGGALQQRLGGRLQHDVRGKVLCLQQRIRHALPRQRPLARCADSPGDDGARLARCQVLQLARRDDGDFDEQIDAVQERPAEPALITRDLCAESKLPVMGVKWINTLPSIFEEQSFSAFQT